MRSAGASGGVEGGGARGSVDEEAAAARLEVPWVWWHEDGSERSADQETFLNRLKQLTVVHTVAEFWSAYEGIPRPSAISFRSAFHVMREGVRPLWEDPANCNGGCCYYRVPKNHTADAWREVLLAVVGNQFHDVCRQSGDEVLGASVSTRRTDDLIVLWNRRANGGAGAKLMDMLKKLLSPFKPTVAYYKPNLEHIKLPGGAAGAGTTPTH